MMLLVTGFFVGVIYTYIVKPETKIFNIEVLSHVKKIQMDEKHYLFYISKERIGLLLLIIFLGQVHWKRVYAGILTVIIGMTLGSVMCISFIGMGIKGIFLCTVGMIPHVFCYGLVLYILLDYWFDEKIGRWRMSKTLGIVLFMCLGIVIEVYVSPFLWRIFL